MYIFKTQALVLSTLVASLLSFSGCGGGSDGGVTNLTGTSVKTPTSSENNSTTDGNDGDSTSSSLGDENAELLNSTHSYTKKITSAENGKYSLSNAPIGMAIYPSGRVVWTPTNEQTGDYNVTINIEESNSSVVVSKKLNLHVTNTYKEYEGVFVDLSGKIGGDGSPNHPYGTYEEACTNLNGKYNIYLRGGVYKNPGYHNNLSKSGRYPAVEKECQGSITHPIIIRPWGNEYVKLKTDALYGIKIKKGAKYITIQNLEIEGEAENITLEEALKYWWWDNNDTMQSSGISINGDEVIIKDNIVHDMPGSGIGASGGTYSTIENNIVYNSDWWTIAGSKGIGITSAKGTTAKGTYKNKIVGNLIFNVEQRLFSHVWAKEYATLTIDEGEAFLIQEGKQTNASNVSEYNGKYLVKDNLMLFNGKTGVINLAKDVNLTNNSYYNNGTATKQSGFRISHTNHVIIVNNAVESNLTNTIIYSCDKFSNDINVSNNYAKGEVVRGDNLIDGIESKDALFKDPKHLDFSIVSGLPQNIGASQDIISEMKRKIELYNIKVENKHEEIDKQLQTKYIVEHAPGTIDCSHYRDEKNPYVLITDIDKNHPLVQKVNTDSFKLFIKNKYGECSSENKSTTVK